jgi:hypothetical protein
VISRPSIAVQFFELRYAHHHHGRTGAIVKVQRRFNSAQKHLGAHLLHPPPELLMIEFIVPDVHPEFFHCRTGFEHDLLIPGVRSCLPGQHRQSGQEGSHPDTLVRLAFEDGIIEVDRGGLCSRNTFSRDLVTIITLRLLTSNGSFAVNIPVLFITICPISIHAISSILCLWRLTSNHYPSGQRSSTCPRSQLPAWPPDPLFSQNRSHRTVGFVRLASL